MTTIHRQNEDETVLVFRIGSMGDTAVALPAFRQIRRWFPRSRIVLLTNLPVDSGRKAASSIDILGKMGLVDRSIEYPHGSSSVYRLLHVLREIRKEGPRICYFLVPQRGHVQRLRDRMFFHLAGIHTIVGLAADVMRHRPASKAGGLWESEAARVMRAIGARSSTLRLGDFSLELSAEERLVGQRALAEAGIKERFIAMSLGTKLPVNEWGDLRWTQCLKALGEAVPGYSLVAIGSGVEFDRSGQVLRSWPWKTANLCGQLAPRQSAAVLEKAQLFLGHDSGPMHLANAVGTPLVAVFSARGMPGIWFPFGQTQNVIYREVPCCGCGLEVCVEKKQKCVTDIGAEEVVAKALKLLELQANRECRCRPRCQG